MADVPKLSVDAKAAAEEVLSMPLQSFMDKVHANEIPFVNYGRGRHRGRYLFLISDLQKWLERNRTPAKWEVEP